MGDEAKNEVAAMRAAMDQARAAQQELAALVGEYMAALVAAGLQRYEALALTESYQAMLLATAFQQRAAE